jgi:protein XagA
VLRIRIVAFLGLGVAAVPTAASAGAWTLDAGQGDAIFTVTPSTAPEAFIGSKSLSPTYNKIEAEGFVEYGVTDRLTAIFAPNLDDIQIGAPTNAGRIGLGYTEFGGRYALLQGSDWIFSGQATLRVPGTFDNSNPAAIGYTSFESDVRGLFGKSFSIGPMPAFIDVQAAQRFSFSGPPNEFHADATFGVRFIPRWLLMVQSFSVVSEGDRLPVFPSYNYSKVQASLVYDLTKQWSLQGGAFTTYEEHNALQEKGLIFGAWYRF